MTEPLVAAEVAEKIVRLLSPEVLRTLNRLAAAEKVIEAAREHVTCRNGNTQVYGGTCVCKGCTLAQTLREYDRD